VKILGLMSSFAIYLYLVEFKSDLADRTNGKGIDHETFLQYFPLNGLLAERLFAQFDVKVSRLSRHPRAGVSNRPSNPQPPGMQ
jgi:hypothetical protein